MSTTVQFTLIDYFLFSIVFIVSIVIGLYFAFKARKHQHVDEYFFGGKKLGVIPVSFSLLATSVTGSTTIGQSMEIYAYGLHAIMYLPMVPIWGSLVYYVFLPVFYELQLKSSFAYLELRFDKSVKHLASGLYVITGLLLIPMTIYVPALSFQEVSGINLYTICLVSGCLCILYTTIGGFKAVIWTDVFQFSLIMLSTTVIFVVGLITVGGYENVWNALSRGERLNMLKSDFNFEQRGSIWAYMFSTPFMLAYISLTQSSIQRFLSLPTHRKANTAVFVVCISFLLILSMHFTIGAVIYTTHEQCDPLTAGIVGKIDQIFAYYVQEKASLFTGFNGIFIAGTFSAGLSTTSTILNTIGGTIYTDFLSNKLKHFSEASTIRITKLIVAVVGAIGIGLIFLIERLGTIFVINVQCFTVSTVGILGLFCSGMIFRNINSKGAKFGVITAMIAIGILIAGTLRKSPDPLLPLRTDGCDGLNTTSFIDFTIRNTTLPASMENKEELPWIFRINFQFFCIIGLFINCFVGSVISYLTGGNEVEDQRLLVKFLRKVVPKETLLNKKESSKT